MQMYICAYEYICILDISSFHCKNFKHFSFVSLSWREYKNSMSDAVQEIYEKFLGIFNLWISIVIYNILLGMVNVHSEWHLGHAVLLLELTGIETNCC